MSSNETLEELRRQIDAIDDRVHDLLIERSGMIEQIVAAKRDGQAKLRPGREALIARRLVGRHRGRFPQASLIRIWREIINAFTCMQGPFEIAVPEPAVDTPVWEATRDYFGGTPTRRPVPSAGAALAAVANGEATLAMLPWGAGASAWVGELLRLGDPGLRVCYGLPFVRGIGEATIAVAIGRVAAEPTGSDRGVVAIEAPGKQPVEAVLAAADLDPVALWPGEGASAGWWLAEIAGAVETGDPRLERAAVEAGAGRVAALGTYAEPIVLGRASEGPTR